MDICPPKFGSERTVYIPQDLVNILSEHVRLHVPDDDPNRCMFTDRRCTPLHQNSAEYQWNRSRAKAGVSYRLHDLRHFFASGLIAAGCERAMGHSAASFTLNTYSHLWPKAADRTRNAAAQMLTEAVAADRVRTGSQ